MTRESVADIVARMNNNFEARCADQGHSWARYSQIEQYCQACGLRRPHPEETA